MKDLLCILR